MAAFLDKFTFNSVHLLPELINLNLFERIFILWTHSNIPWLQDNHFMTGFFANNILLTIKDIDFQECCSGFASVTSAAGDTRHKEYRHNKMWKKALLKGNLVPLIRISLFMSPFIEVSFTYKIQIVFLNLLPLRIAIRS